MITQSKQHFVSIDDEAMNSIIKRIEPFLKQESSWNEHEQDIGFAVAMDFYPSEDMGEAAVRLLLGPSNQYGADDCIIH